MEARYAATVAGSAGRASRYRSPAATVNLVLQLHIVARRTGPAI
jgi:hypothetical protein